MRHFQWTDTKPERFEVLGKTAQTQAATMALAPKESTGGPENQHAKSDQRLYVVSGLGLGRAKVGFTEVLLREATPLLIEARETHEIVNTGDEPLRTINFYAPPAY